MRVAAEILPHPEHRSGRFILALCGGMFFAPKDDREHQSRKSVSGEAVENVTGLGGKKIKLNRLTCRFAGAAILLVSAWLLPGIPAVAQTAVKVSLDTRFEATAAPFLLALDKGYYRDEKLDVAIEPGTNPLEPITRVASGTHDIGFADINAMIRHRDQNPNGAGKAVFMVYNRHPYAIIARKSRGIEVPKDLEGKKLGAPVTDLASAAWKIFAQANAIDASKVSVENVGIPVREPMLAAGQLDAITGLSFSSFVNLKDRGVPADDIVVLRMANHGVDLYGNAIIVNPKFAAEKPEAVAAFLRAFLKGLRETVRDPAHAVDSALRRNELATKAVEVERLRLAIHDNIVTPEVREQGFGDVDPARLEKSIDQLALTYEFKAKPKPADVFDPAFLPDAALRRVR
jgi:NitT/TauT family transport system substrate-binding protein